MAGSKQSRNLKFVLLVVLFGGAAVGQTRVQVVSPAAITLVTKCGKGETCNAGSACIIVAAPGMDEKLALSVRSFDADGEIQKIEVSPATARAEADHALALRVRFSGVLSKLPVRGRLIVASGGDVATIPLEINPPPVVESGQTQARRRRVEQVLGTSLGIAILIVAVCTLILWRRKKNFGFLHEKMGLASWDLGSWASNAGVLSGLVTSMIAIPGAVEIAKYPWAMDFALIGIFAALLTAVGPLIFNLTRHFNDDKPPIQVNWVAVFLLSVISSIAGVATSWQMLWYANKDLVENEILTSSIGLGVNWALALIAAVFLVYFVYGIVRIATEEPSKVKEPDKTAAEERQIPVTVPLPATPRWSVL
jgi:hypothetical protein